MAMNETKVRGVRQRSAAVVAPTPAPDETHALADGAGSLPSRPGSFVGIRPTRRAGSGAVRRRAAEGFIAEPRQPTTAPRGAAPDPTNPACPERRTQEANTHLEDAS